MKRRYARNGSLRAFTKAHAKRAVIRAAIADKSGGGKVISSRPEQGFSCSGTFIMTKLH